MRTKRRTQSIPSRVERLSSLYRSIQIQIWILAVVSSMTLSVAIFGFIATKLNFTLTEIWIAVIGTISILVALYWDGTVIGSFKEVFRTIVNREASAKNVKVFILVLFVVAGVMAMVSVIGSMTGGVEVAEITVSTPEQRSISQSIEGVYSITSDKVSNIDNQIKVLREERSMALAGVKEKYDAKIKQDDIRAKTASEEDKAWLIGSKRKRLLRQKEVELKQTTALYDKKEAPLVELKLSILKNAENQEKVITNEVIQYNTQKQEEQFSKRERTAKAFGNIAIYSTPLYIFLVFLQALIENVLSIKSKEDLNTAKEVTKEVPKEQEETVKVISFDRKGQAKWLKTYYRRYKENPTDARKEGIKRYANSLTEHGYEVFTDVDGKIHVSTKQGVVPLNSKANVKFFGDRVEITTEK